MENLTEKELAAYLPYGLKYQSEHIEGSRVYEVIGINNKYNYIYCTNDCGWSYIKGIKPILHPLSSLTRPITINGETFVPIIKWEWFGADFNTNYFNHTNFKPRYEPYYKSEQMLSAYFDIFNLIERGLAIPVTETFNPYK
jgi:hypothetical protein